jgi:hypothetical protein
MNERIYDRPKLVLLDADGFAGGYCTTGGGNLCTVGTGAKSAGGGQCLTGDYAGSCSVGTGQGAWDCKAGNKATFCTTTGTKAVTTCIAGNRALGMCSVGSKD